MKTLAFAYAILLAFCTAGAAQATSNNYVSNGSFEASGASLVDGSYCYLNVASHECGGVTGWSGQFPLIQSVSGPWGVPNSPYGAFLAGLQGQSHFEQTLALPAAGRYTLSWSDAGRANYGSGPQSYRVSFGGVSLETRSVSMGAAWSGHALTFTATGVGELRFDGLNGDGDRTAFIDNILLLAPVPEPSSYSMLLIGLGLLAFSTRRETPEKFIK